MKKLTKKRKPPPIPLSAMGDIAFLLLVFYLATTMVTDQKQRPVDLTALEAGNKNSPYPLIIYLDKEMADSGRAYFFNDAVPLEELPGLVQERAAFAPAAVRVFLNIGRDLPYTHMNDIIQALKEAGISNLVITTNPAEKPTPAEAPTI